MYILEELNEKVEVVEVDRTQWKGLPDCLGRTIRERVGMALYRDKVTIRAKVLVLR